MTVAGQHGRAGACADPAVGHEQVGRHRHGVLGVEDDLVPHVAVAADRLERLDVATAPRSGSGPSSSVRRARPRLTQAGIAGGVALGQGVLVGRGGQADHPLVPGRVVPVRRGQDEGPWRVSAHDSPFHAAARRWWRANVGDRRAPGRPFQVRQCFSEVSTVLLELRDSSAETPWQNRAVTLATSVSVHPISPAIGAEISGVDLSDPLCSRGGGGDPRRAGTPTTSSSSGTSP